MCQQSDMPQIPTITQEQLEQCRISGDYCPILFEWYKFTGELCMFFARLRPDSLGFIQIESLYHAIFVGLLNRCSRLMLANIKLSHQGMYGETTSIIDRCIFESCIKIIWICNKNSTEKFQQYIADGLKTELRLKEKINENIISRGSKKLVIEKRMLESIDKYIASSKLTEEKIKSMKKLPSLFDMVTEVQDDLSYIVGQKIGSHHVHGTWPSLLMHYLTLNESGFFAPRDHDCITHENQYVIIPLFVLKAIEAYVQFIISEQTTKNNCLGLLKATKEEILKLNKEIIGDDFELLEV